MYAVFEPDFTALAFVPCFTNGSKNLELASSDVALLVYPVPLIGGTLGHDEIGQPCRWYDAGYGAG